MDKNKFQKLRDVSDTLCEFCGSVNCKTCPVTHLLNDAETEEDNFKEENKMTVYDLRDNLNDAIEEGLGPHKLKDNFSVYDYLEDNTFDELARIGNKYMLDFNIQPIICSTAKTIRYALTFARLGDIGWLKNNGSLETVAGYGYTVEEAAKNYYDKIINRTLVFNPDGKSRYEVTFKEDDIV